MGDHPGIYDASPIGVLELEAKIIRIVVLKEIRELLVACDIRSQSEVRFIITTDTQRKAGAIQP